MYFGINKLTNQTMRLYLIILSLFFCGVTFAQNTISGTVTDDSGLPLPGATIKIIGESTSTLSDAGGNFKMTPKSQPPFTVEISNIGFASQSIEVASLEEKISVSLIKQEVNLDEIVVSASRTPERILESPVTIERMGIKEVKNTSSATFYDGLENLKEVHFNSSSLSFML